MKDGARSPLVLLTVFVAALMWGLYWLPVRWLESAGLPGAWAGLALALGALPALGAFCLWRGGAPLDTRMLAGAVALGGAFALYAAALAFTDVVRAILIFYLAPAWSLLIEAAFLGRRLGWQSGLAVAASLAGIALVCRLEVPLAGLGATGDWMALASGVLWAVSAAILFSSRAPDLGRTALIAMTAAAGVSLGVILFAGTGASGSPDTGVLWAVLLGALAFGVLFNGPIMVVTIWGAVTLPPATVTFLLTAEIVSGVVSSALFLDEPFGLWEAAGTVMIVAGALIEILFPPQRRPAT